MEEVVQPNSTSRQETERPANLDNHAQTKGNAQTESPAQAKGNAQTESPAQAKSHAPIESQARQASKAGKYLVWRVGERKFAVPLAEVHEIIAMPSVTNLPDFHRTLKGVFNLRGKIISIADIRDKLAGRTHVERSQRPYVIAIDALGCEMGVVVDDIVEVAMVDPSEIRTEIDARFAGRVDARYIRGAITRASQDQLVILIDMPQLLGISSVTESGEQTVA